MVGFLVAAAIFGFAATFIVPWVSGMLGGFVPTNYKKYLPASTIPSTTAASLIGVLVYGALLALVLLGLSKAGIHKHLRGVEA